MTNDPQTLLSNAQCYVCEGVSIEQALELALLASIVNAPPNVLTLEPITNAQLNWDWAGPNPDHWEVQYSADGATGWIDIRAVAGNLRTDPIDDGLIYVRLIGRDVANNNVTPYSNVEFSG